LIHTVGALSLGAGDFMFLALYTLVLYRDFGSRLALVHIAAQGVALLVTGLVITSADFIVPFLVVLAPIFLTFYGAAYFVRRRTRRTALPTG
ncbi:MAG: hypothetical protein V1916_01660, partial [Patescibacteria group bacterium]